ncbi:MAG: fatty acid desaturase [Proteobacteria bacterium]|nr:fatty acid desaturase [Pseudomonadota bacterium]
MSFSHPQASRKQPTHNSKTLPEIDNHTKHSQAGLLSLIPPHSEPYKHSDTHQNIHLKPLSTPITSPNTSIHTHPPHLAHSIPCKLNWGVTLMMTAIHLIAFLFAYTYWSWSAVGVCMVLSFLTGCIGVSMGMHRLFSHRTFKVSKQISYIIGLFSTLAFQGPIAEWVARHRMHHAGSDTHEDPHNVKRGFFYAHMGWLLYHNDHFNHPNKIKAYSRDILQDPVLKFMSTRIFMITAQCVLALLLWLIGGMPWLVWGTFVRLAINYHSTWLVNSAAHLWGYKTYPTNDEARNNWWVALLTWGEGWHNNHHAHASSARIGHKRWEIDITHWMILLLAKLGLASDIKDATQKPKKKTAKIN